jgi:hypothetical protein
MSNMDNKKVFKMSFSDIYSMYIDKAVRKGRKKADVDTVICWLTGYSQRELEQQIACNCNLEIFFAQSPKINPNVSKITGVICGYRVEEIEDKLMQQIRYADKLVDELAKGKSMDKILRA